jgi:predicted transcriptional regulator
MPETQNPPSNDAKPKTAEAKVRRTLEANPCTTTANLAKTAGVGRSTASKLLSRWVREGLVIRTTGDDQSVPVTWTLHDEQNHDAVGVKEADDGTVTTTSNEPEAARDDVDEEAVPDLNPSTSNGQAIPEVPTTDTPKKERLAKGALYELVKEFLHVHPGEEFGPAKISTELGRSSGAVNNALEKLVTSGLATKTCEAPKRFTFS